MTRARAGRPLDAVFAAVLLVGAFGSVATPGRALVCASGGTPGGQPLSAEFLRTYRASFATPGRLAVDALGQIYVTDTARGAVLVRDAEGHVLGMGENLGRPSSVAVTPAGDRIFVGDAVTGRVTAYTPDWLPLFDLGQGIGEFSTPADIAVDPATGQAWVTDSSAHRVDVYSANGDHLFGFGGRGDGAGQFQSPMGIFVDAAAGEVLVADQLNGRIQLFDLAGGFKSCVGVKGSGPGRLNMPQGLWADEHGRIYVSDAFEGRVHVVDRLGATVSFLGGVGDVGVGPGRLATPGDLVVDPSGRLVVSSATTARLEMFGLDGFADPERFVPAELVLDATSVDLSAPLLPLAAIVEVPGYRLDLVELATLAANGVAPEPGSIVVGDADGDRQPDLQALFDPAAVAATLPPNGGSVRVSARLAGLELEGFAQLQVIGRDGDDDSDSDSDSDDDSDSDSAKGPKHHRGKRHRHGRGVGGGEGRP